MPVDPARENEVRNQVEQEFRRLEHASAEAGVGVFDVLQVYGGLDAAMRQADAYLALLNPAPATFSTTSSSNVEG